MRETEQDRRVDRLPCRAPSLEVVVCFLECRLRLDNAASREHQTAEGYSCSARASPVTAPIERPRQSPQRALGGGMPSSKQHPIDLGGHLRNARIVNRRPSAVCGPPFGRGRNPGTMPVPSPRDDAHVSSVQSPEPEDGQRNARRQTTRIQEHETLRERPRPTDIAVS